METNISIFQPTSIPSIYAWNVEALVARQYRRATVYASTPRHAADIVTGMYAGQAVIIGEVKEY